MKRVLKIKHFVPKCLLIYKKCVCLWSVSTSLTVRYKRCNDTVIYIVKIYDPVRHLQKKYYKICNISLKSVKQ